MNNNATAKKHSNLYNITLWTAVGAFALSALVTVGLILFTDFNDRGSANLMGRVAFITWQVLWFGLLSVAFAKIHESAAKIPAKSVAIAAVLSCLYLLLVGIFQAAFDDPGGEILVRSQYAVGVFMYSAFFLEVFLLYGERSFLRTVLLACDITAGLMGAVVFAIMTMIMIGEDPGEALWRFAAVFVILGLTGLIVIAILSTMAHSRQVAAEMQQYMQAQGQPERAAMDGSVASVDSGAVVASAEGGVAGAGSQGSGSGGAGSGSAGVGSGASDADSSVEPEHGSRMNKAAVLAKLKEETGRSEKDCIIINNVLENHFLIGRKGKKDIVDDFVRSLSIEKAEADKLYDTCCSIIMQGIFGK